MNGPIQRSRHSPGAAPEDRLPTRNPEDPVSEAPDRVVGITFLLCTLWISANGRSDAARTYKHITFAGPPYVIMGLRPQSYTVSAIIGTAFLSPGHEHYSGLIDVAPGDARKIRLVFRE